MQKKGKKAPKVISITEVKASSPLSKLHGRLRDLDNLHAAANPDSGYGPANVKAPKEIEQAANQVAQHIDGLMQTTRKALKGGSYAETVANNVAKKMTKK